LAFEIIEHLMNPLWFLWQVRQALKPDGTLCLSTPINKPKFFWRPDHFHEVDEYRLNRLIERAGFEIIRRERKRFYRINGLRSIIRYVLKTGTMFMEVKPNVQ
jgi:2-polyprenyl-3-methyl-5-hydroxy-6-metoxy-1,4-benzoquinol methylase